MAKRKKEPQKPQKQVQEPPKPAEKLPEQHQPPEQQGLSQLAEDDLTMLHKLAAYMERVNLADYVRLTQKPKRLIGLNFLGGVARGFGMAVGFTLLGALGIYILNQLNVLNLPVIGDFIAKILEYVEISRGMSI